MGRKMTEMGKLRCKANWLQKACCFQRRAHRHCSQPIHVLGTLNTRKNLPIGIRLYCWTTVLGKDTGAMNKLSLGPDATQLCCAWSQLIHLAAQKKQKQRAAAHVEIQTMHTGKTLGLKEILQQECTSTGLSPTGTGTMAKEKSQPAEPNIIDWAEKKKRKSTCSHCTFTFPLNSFPNALYTHPEPSKALFRV